MLSIRMFGETEVQAGARTLGLRDFGSVKSRQILELLVLHRGTSLTKDELADLVWDGAPPSDFISTVESYVSVLRGRLQPGVARAQSVILTGRNSYALNVEKVCVDLDEFDRLVDDRVRDRGARGCVAAAPHHLRAALKLARGPVLTHEPYAAWAAGTRDRYRTRVVAALTASAEHCLQSHEVEQASALADSAVRLDPLSEGACQMAMRTQWLAGRRVAALRTYEGYRTALRDDLGIDPGAQIKALFVSILQADPVEEPDDGASELGTLVGAVIELYHRGSRGVLAESRTVARIPQSIPRLRTTHATDSPEQLLIDLIARSSAQQAMLPVVC